MNQPYEQQLSTTFDVVTSIVTEILGIPERAANMMPTTQLLDGIPEFDSMAVVEIVAAVEEHFGITVDDEDISAETFDTLGSLTRLIDEKRGVSGGR